MWYEVRTHVDDIPWIYGTVDEAYRKAQRVAEQTGYPALVYRCGDDDEMLIAEFD